MKKLLKAVGYLAVSCAASWVAADLITGWMAGKIDALNENDIPEAINND